MTTAAKPITDETLLADVLTSPKNIALLAKNGVNTVGDAKKLTITDIVKMGVGDVTTAEIRDLGVKQAAESADSKIEESMNDIQIISDSSEFCLQVLPGDMVPNPNGKGRQILRPLYVTCVNGKGRLSAKMWYTRIYNRNRQEVDAALAAHRPWRIAAYEWLQRSKSFKNKFRVLSD